MTYDRKDWIDRVAARRADQAQDDDRRRLELVAQAAVPAEKLMSDPNWAIYQQQLQAAIERMRAHRTRLAETLNSPGCIGHEDMLRVKILILECDAMVNAWQAAIDLPRTVMESAERAAKVLEKLTEKYDSTA